MEIKAELQYPYTEEQRVEFIIEENHKKGYEIREYVHTHSKEIEVDDYETIKELVDVEVRVDEEGQPIIEQQEVEKRVKVGTHLENREEEVIDLQAWGYTEEEIEEQKKEAIKQLTCTKRVFALMLKELGVDYLTQLKPLIESNPDAQLEWELCVELLRANPMLDLMGKQLGITSEQLNKLFQYANGQITKEEFIG